MAKTPVYMPKFGMTMMAAEIMEWYVEQGEEITQGDPLLSIETEKTTVDIEAPCNGYLTNPLYEVGEEVEVGTILVYVADTEEEAAEGTEVQENMQAQEETKEPDLQPGKELSKIRRTIADNMKSSLQKTAQLTLLRTIRVDKLAEYKAGLTGVSYNDLLVKALAKALSVYPKACVQLADGRAIEQNNMDIGLAVAMEEGLIVPVIRSADKLCLEDVAKERKNLVKAARDGSLLPEQTGNAVATLTNLGPQNVDFFTPILNFPETVILGVGRMNTVPWVEDDKITTAKTIGFSLTFDHQVLDGKDAAELLEEFAKVLEHPSSLSE